MRRFLIPIILLSLLNFGLAAPDKNVIASKSILPLAVGCTHHDFDSTLSPAWQFVDPLGDSSFNLTGNPGYLRISVPHADRDLSFGNVNAPRMVQTLNGDFDIRTGVEASPTSGGYQSAGILVWMDSSNYIWVGRSVGNVISHRYMRQNSDEGLNPPQIGYPANNVHFRITRVGNTFTTFYSSNGYSWIQSGSIEYSTAPSELQIGMFLINRWVDVPFQADFDYFTVNCTDFRVNLPVVINAPRVAHNEKTVMTLAYIDATPLYNIDAHQALLLSGLRSASTWHGYDHPEGVPSLGYTTYDGQIIKIYEIPPYRSDNGKFDYAAVYDRFGICEKIQQGLVDEVWIWESGSGNAWEWVTNGPNWSWTWGSNVPNCGRTVTTLNFNYQREIDVAFESFHHRMEGAFMTHRPCDFYTNSWPWTGWPSRCAGLVSDIYGFVARPFSGNGFVAVCGDAHHPPNILNASEYVYDDPTTVTSICKDWQWGGSATRSSFNCTEWGCTHAGFHIWWMQNLPGYGNNNHDRYGNLMPDWWEILFY
jgi:regulation of enolase protein 1 (concanavalin A-like superfamily)